MAKIAVGDPFEITCGISIYKNYSNEINWYKKDLNGTNDELIYPSSTSTSSKHPIFRTKY